MEVSFIILIITIEQFSFEDGKFHMRFNSLAKIAFVLDITLENLVLEVVVYGDVGLVFMEGELIGKIF